MAKSTIILSAEDRTAAAWASAQRNASQSISQIQRMIPGLAGALSAAGLVSFAKQGIDAADSLNDLSKSTNIGVKDLAGLRLLAMQTGTDLDGLAKGINKMSVEIGKDPEKFRKLGITAKDNLGAFKQFADVFEGLADINQRNALSQAVFGKSWQELAPALSEGGRQIGEIIERGTRLSGVTQEIAEQSDKFNDKWAELTGTGAIFNRVVGPALPLMNELADVFLRAGNNSTGFATSLKPVAEVLRVLMVVGSDVQFTFETIGMDAARALENIKLIAKGDFEGSRKLGELFRKDAEDRRKALDEWQKRVMGLDLTGQSSAAKGVKTPAQQAAEAQTAARAAAFLAGGEKANSAADRAHREFEAMAAVELKGYQELAKLRADQRREDVENAAQMGAQFRELYEEDQKARIDLEIQAGEDMKALRERFREDEFAKYTAFREKIGIELMTEQEQLRFHYEEDFNLLNDANAKKYIANAEYYALMGRLVTRHEKEKTRLEDEEYKKRFGIATRYRAVDLGSAGFFFDQMSGLMQTKSRTLFEIGKAGAIAGAVIDTYKAATGAYAALASIPFVGPALGAAAAAAAVAIGMARVQAIKSTSFGGGGAAGTGVFAANPSTGLPESPTSAFDAPQNPIAQSQSPRRMLNLNIQFVGSGRYTQEEIRDSLVPALREALGDGVEI